MTMKNVCIFNMNANIFKSYVTESVHTRGADGYRRTNICEQSLEETL